MKEVIVSHPLPPFATLARFKRISKQLLKAYRENPSLCEERVARACPHDLRTDFKLADAQRVVAREHGFDSWAKLKQYLEGRPPEQLVFDAVASGDVGAVESLLADHPGLIEARSGWQLYRPLFFAKQADQNAAVDVLRQHGATLDVFEAAALGDLVELKKLLSASPELAGARREHGDATPLHAARGHVEAARMLIEFGADVNAIDGSKQRLTPLHCRAEHGDIEMVNLLLEHGADVQAGSCMSTPLHCTVGGFQHAPAHGWREVAERLLHAGADINAGSPETGDPNWTPLHHAAWRNHIAAVYWLLEHGADRTRVNKYGNTPLETAKYFGHSEIVRILSVE
ncbi:MAG TPA: ankyrin repeat domain-containing protein [Pirellulales bacterium]|nr:ankyrin repeat domain-containing protein [Pirellulales bacterium]